LNKRILVTGGAGFIAHHFIFEVLIRTDWDVVTIDRLDYSGNYNRLQEILEGLNPAERKRVTILYHDLKAEINPHIASRIGKIDYVAHIAAASHVDRSIEDPMSFVMDNVVGTTNILNYARQLDSLEKFIYFSTDEVFGPAPEGVSYKENDRYNSTNPYSASKAAGEEMAVAFENTYGMPIIITHTMNVFGERQHPEKYIPMCIRKIRDGETITVHSNAEKTKAGSRHYIHAHDVADACLFLLLNDFEVQYDYGHAKCPKYNIVGPTELDNLALAHLIADYQGKQLRYEMVDFHSARPGHDLRYALSGEKLAKLGWKPKPTHDRLMQVVDWTLKNPHWMEV